MIYNDPSIQGLQAQINALNARIHQLEMEINLLKQTQYPFTPITPWYPDTNLPPMTGPDIPMIPSVFTIKCTKCGVDMANVSMYDCPDGQCPYNHKTLYDTGRNNVAVQEKRLNSKKVNGIM